MAERKQYQNSTRTMNSRSEIASDREHGMTRRRLLQAGLVLGFDSFLLRGSPISPDRRASKLFLKPPEMVLPASSVPPLPEFIQPEKNQRVLVIPLLSPGETAPVSREDLIKITNNVHDYYAGESYGKIDYSFDICDWQRTAAHVDQHNLDLLSEQFAAAGDKAAVNADVENIGQYQTRVYIMNVNIDTFNAGGRGQKRQPAIYNRVWLPIFGNNYQLKDPATWEHELGHTLGLPHDDLI